MSNSKKPNRRKRRLKKKSKVKKRIPVPPGDWAHKSKKDYDRKIFKQISKKEIEENDG